MPINEYKCCFLRLLVGLVVAFYLPVGEAIVCYHCDSIALPECAQTLGEVGLLPYVECSSELTCSMSIVDSITYRGCGADTPTTGAAYSKSCATNLCNSGVYPPGRLKCHQCSPDESCVAAPLGKPRPCLYHQEEDECYTDILSTTEGYRGCKSDVNHTVTNTAVECDYNGCNNQLGAWSQICAQCDSTQTGRGCKIDLFQLNTGLCNISLYEECHQEIHLGQEEQEFCFSYRHLNRMVRGCSTQLPEDLEPIRDQLETCQSGDHCNARCITQQRCLSCNSVDNPLCRTNTTALSTSLCGSAEASSCFACEYTDWEIRRGCGAPPSGEANIRNCYECDEDGGCNELDFTRCYRCTTDQTGPGCANWEVPGGIYIEECAQPAASCLIVSYSNGSLERGCQRDDFNCESSNVSNCQRCDGSFCNKGAFPEQRLWCHQCTDCDQISRGQSASPCPWQENEPADQIEGCLEYYDVHQKKTIRGCRTTPELYYQCMLRSEDKCRLCHDQACNNSPGEDLRPYTVKALALLPGKSIASRALKTIDLCFWLLIIYQVIALN
ncbi:uncharacterized protein LOC6641773 [Drosophila willistoni]|uniref:uncharacterized protein LOC6641773 n=1 Tax=Drosophila willistoni TaxID=7260 RepID=UPI000C26D9D5|nr:uncharacterized protein LOC6641773 [Drosophila willistoni]